MGEIGLRKKRKFLEDTPPWARVSELQDCQTASADRQNSPNANWKWKYLNANWGKSKHREKSKPKSGLGRNSQTASADRPHTHKRNEHEWKLAARSQHQISLMVISSRRGFHLKTVESLWRWWRTTMTAISNEDGSTMTTINTRGCFH